MISDNDNNVVNLRSFSQDSVAESSTSTEVGSKNIPRAMSPELQAYHLGFETGSQKGSSGGGSKNDTMHTILIWGAMGILLAMLGGFAKYSLDQFSEMDKVHKDLLTGIHEVNLNMEKKVNESEKTILKSLNSYQSDIVDRMNEQKTSLDVLKQGFKNDSLHKDLQ